MNLLLNRTRTNKALKIKKHAYIHDENRLSQDFFL